jgi:tripartite-type tricarboxylate transporter receptor subunit TctC
MKFSVAVARMLTAAFLTALAGLAVAQQAYPSRPVRVIVPFPPGAGLDIIARTIVPRMSESLGQPFVVDNRAGAAGIIGAELVARSPADGYTLLVAGNVAIQPLVTKVTYRARDFAPISMIASVPNILVVHPGIPVKSLDDLVALARAKPGVINFASTGNWSTPHLITELFMREAKINLVHVPYKGSAPAIVDLLGGQIQMFFCNMLSAIPHVSNGKLRALAVTSSQRSPAVPQVPTVAESGFPGFEADTTFGIWAPAGVPKHVVAKLHAEVVKALSRPDVQQQLASQGASAIGTGPDEYADYLKSNTEKWSKVLKSAGAKVE